MAIRKRKVEQEESPSGAFAKQKDDQHKWESMYYTQGITRYKDRY